MFLLCELCSGDLSATNSSAKVTPEDIPTHSVSLLEASSEFAKLYIGLRGAKRIFRSRSLTHQKIGGGGVILRLCAKIF